MLEKLFKLKKNDTTVKTEVIAGLTTFMTMAYILAVNPSMLNAAGMDTNAALIATALAAFIGTLAMAFWQIIHLLLLPAWDSMLTLLIPYAVPWDTPGR